MEQQGQKAAQKDSGGIPGENHRATRGLAAFPDCPSVKPLANHQYGYRLRVGRYRILFDHDDAIRIIAIQEVKKRDERTY